MIGSAMAQYIDCIVTPAQAGVQWNLQASTECHWIPACAGMTKKYEGMEFNYLSCSK